MGKKLLKRAVKLVRVLFAGTNWLATDFMEFLGLVTCVMTGVRVIVVLEILTDYVPLGGRIPR